MRWSSLTPSLVTRLYVRSGLTIHANFRRGLLACLAAAVVLAPGAGVGAATPRPDLTVSALTAKGSLVPGSRIRMTVTTRNSGAAPSKASTTRLYLSRDGRRSSDDRSLASTRIPGLAPGRSVTRTLAATVPATSPPAGRLLGCADTASRNAESREANNCRVTPDHDRDGYSSFGDCAPRNRAVHPGVNDQPDVPAFTDNNCDGIDGTARLAVFVSGVGSNDNPGHPGQTEADARGRCRHREDSGQSRLRDVRRIQREAERCRRSRRLRRLRHRLEALAIRQDADLRRAG